MLAMGIVARGKRAYGPTWDPTKLDNLTLGLARYCRRRLHRLPGGHRRHRAHPGDERPATTRRTTSP